MAKFDHITVKLSGKDGNAFMIMGIVTKAMRANKVPEAEIKRYMDLAMAGDYDNLLKVTVETVNVE